MSMTEAEFWAALAPQPPAPEPVYRLYYDHRGDPLFYSMEDRPGNYIEVDQETYHQAPRYVRVRDGKLHIINRLIYPRLVPGDQGVACSPQDVCVVVSPDQPHVKWSLKTYESD